MSTLPTTAKRPDAVVWCDGLEEYADCKACFRKKCPRRSAQPYTMPQNLGSSLEMLAYTRGRSKSRGSL